MNKPGSISLALLNAIQLAILAAIVCLAAALPEAFFRNGGGGNAAKAEHAARALAGAIDRAIGEIDRNGRLLGAVLQGQSELSGSAKADLLQRWLVLQPRLRGAALVGPMGVTLSVGSENGADDVRGSWFAPDRIGDTLVEARDVPGGQILVAVPIADGAQAERLVMQIGPDWLATLQYGLLQSFALDGARLKFSVSSAAGPLTTGPNPLEGGAHWSTGSATTQGSPGVASPGWTITAFQMQGGGTTRMAWAAGLVLIAGLCGYGLAGAMSRRLRSISRAGESDEAIAPASRIKELDALEAAFDTRAKRLVRAREEAQSDLFRLRARLGTFETLSGWTCWEIDLVTQRVIWSESIDRDREDASANFAGDHAVDLSELVEGIDPADRPLMHLTMQSALAVDGPHDVSLRAYQPGQDGRERRLLVRFRRSAGGSDAASLRLFALSREIIEAQAEPIDDPRFDRKPGAAEATERRRDHTMRSIIDGIVYDINNVLTVIGANLAVLQRRGLADRESRFLHNALIGSERGAAITRRMVVLARRSTADRAQIDLAGCIAALLPFLQAKVLGDLPIMNRVPDDLPNVHCSERILEAVLLNLAFHFRENGFDGLALAAREAEGEDGERGFVRLLVASGRPSPRSGTGQATRLAMAARLLETSDCRLHIIEHGYGNEPFHAELLMPAEMRQAAPQVRHKPTRGLRLLLVEPDTMVRSSIADLLGELGHAVKHSASAEHALNRLSRPHLFDAVIVSHAMPALNGLHLAATVAERHRGLSIIVAGPHGHLPASADRFLRLDKPFRLEDLVAVLSAIEIPTVCAA